MIKAMGLLAALALCLPAAANIVRNPGFDQGAEYWESQRFNLGTPPKWARAPAGTAGTACAGFYCTSELLVGAYIRQLLPTIAGTEYDLSFWVGNLSGTGKYSVFWDGVMIDGIHMVDKGPMTQVNFSGLYASANATLLEVHGRSDPYYIAFDDFRVVSAEAPASLAAAAIGPDQENAVPEPAVIGLVLAGLVLVGAVRRSQ